VGENPIHENSRWAPTATKSINSKEPKLFAASLWRPGIGVLCGGSFVTRFFSAIHLLSWRSRGVQRLFALKLPGRQQLAAAPDPLGYGSLRCELLKEKTLMK